MLQSDYRKEEKGITVIEFLGEEKIDSNLIQGIVDSRASHPVRKEERGRILMPRYLYYGREVWKQATIALLRGQNLLLAGPEATGKNILTQNLAVAFGRPVRDISLHVNMDASGLIGTNTFQGEAVVFQPEPVYRCGTGGDFGVLDKTNMARNEVLAVLHGTLDFRRTINVPGHDVTHMNGGTRFIATMSYGCAGTRKLDGALTSRFACLQMPTIPGENLEKLMSRGYSGLKRTYARQSARPFLDIDRKRQSTQLSTRPLDFRGPLDVIQLMERGLDAGAVLDMGLINKSFNPYGQNLVWDLIKARIPKKLGRERLFVD